MSNAAEEDFDFYDGLLDPPGVSGVSAVNDKAEAWEERCAKLEEQLTLCREENKTAMAALEQTKKVLATSDKVVTALKKNISCLYKTAKLEIERKGAEIKSLRARLDLLEQEVQSGRK